MSRSQWRDGEGRLDVLRVLVDFVQERHPRCRVLPALDPATSFDDVAERPVVVVEDALPADPPRTAWGQSSPLLAQGFDVDVFAEQRPVAVALAGELARICPDLMGDPETGVVDAWIGGSPHTRPWSVSYPGEKLYHRRGFELYATYRARW